MSERKEYLTKEKFEELRLELEHLKKVKRREIAENLENAKSLGDLSENAEYHEARDMQAEIEDRIAKLEDVLKSAEIVSAKSSSSDAVSVGSRVNIKKEREGTDHAYTIVGSEEADVGQGKISIHSPLGEALIGKKKDDLVTVKTPKGSVSYQIINIK